MRNPAKYQYLPAAVLLLMIAVAASLWQCNGVDWVDDMQYKRMPGEGIEFWYNEGPFIETVTDACQAVYYHHTMVTSRLPNYIQGFTNLIPPVVTDITHGVMIAVFFFMTIISINGRATLRSPMLAGITALAIWTMLPWYDNMLSSDFLFNYVWVSVACLFFIRLFYSDDLLTRRWKFTQWIIAFIVGTMHEGFTFAIAAGAFLAIFTDSHDRKRRMTLVLTLLTGAIFCFLTPGIFERLQDRVVEQSSGSPLQVITTSIHQIYSIYALIAVSIIVIFTRGKSLLIKLYKKNILYLGAIITGYFIAIASGAVHRGLWCAELMGIVLTLKILHETYRWWRHPHLPIGIIAGAAVLTSMLGTAIWQAKFSAETREMCRQVEATGQPVAYIDLIDPGDAPWWTLDIPQSIASSYGNRCYCYHYGYIENQNILILPTRYRNTPVSQWDKTPGNANVMGQFPYYVTTTPTDGILYVTAGNHQAAAGPLDRILSIAAGGDNDRKIVPTRPYYWKLILETGDTLYCHNINRLGRAMRHREIVSIDKK